MLCLVSDKTENKTKDERVNTRRVVGDSRRRWTEEGRT